MSKNILGLCIVTDAADTTEKYVEYLLEELRSVCAEVEIRQELADYEAAISGIEEDVRNSYDAIIVVDTDGFGPVVPLRQLLAQIEKRECESYSIPHFLFSSRGCTDWEKPGDADEVYDLYEGLRTGNFVFLPKEAFIHPKRFVLKHNSGADVRKSLDYVRENTKYDIALVYDYLIRHYDVNDIKDNLNLHYILPEKYRPGELCHKKVAVISHMYYEDLFAYGLSYLKNIPSHADLYLTTDSQEKKEQLNTLFAPVFGQRLHILVVEKRGRELSALLISCREIPAKYDYLCFIHDKKSSQLGLATVGASFRDLLWENMLYNENYIEHILETFENNPWLGMLLPPNVSHGTYFGTSADYWTICYDKVAQLTQRLKLSAQLDRSKPPMAIGSVFWCRTDAVAPLFEEHWKYEDFPQEPLPDDGSFSHALERLFPYVAQSQGYVSGIVMTTEHAQTEITNYRYMMAGTIKSLIGLPVVKMTDYDEFSETTRQVSEMISEGVFDPGLKRSVKNYIRKHTSRNHKK